MGILFIVIIPFHSMSDGMTKIKNHTGPRIALVFFDNRNLDKDAAMNDGSAAARIARSSGSDSNAAKKVSTAEGPTLNDLRKTVMEVTDWQGINRSGSMNTPRGW